MTLLHYIDNEVPLFGEWDAVVSGTSTIVESASASFPDRGSVGLRCTFAGDSAYVRKNVTHDMAEGESVFVGFWLRINTLPPSSTVICYLRSGVDMIGLIYLQSTGVLYLGCKKDDGGTYYGGTSVMPTDMWLYVVLEAKRANAGSNDGYLNIYVNGKLEAAITGVDNDAKCTS